VGNLLKFFTGVVQQAEVFYLQKRYIDASSGAPSVPVHRPHLRNREPQGVRRIQWRVSSPENFINQFVGTFDAETSADAESRLRSRW